MKYTIQDFLSSKIALDVNKKDRPEFNRLMDETGMKWGCGHEASKHDWFPCVAENKVLRWSRGSLPVVNFSDLLLYSPADFFSGRIGVRCETREEYDALMRECEAKGLRWATGVAPSHESIIGFFGDKYPVQIATNAINERALYWRDKTQDLRGNIPCVPFRAIFPDPWAEFCAGKCYLRVKKAEWVEFAKRCIEAGMRWKSSGPIQPVGYRGCLGGDGDYFTQGDGKFLDGYNINTRADMPRYDFSALLPAPAKAPEPPKYKVGDLFRVITNKPNNTDLVIGDIVRVIEESMTPSNARIKNIKTGKKWYMWFRDMEPYTAPAPSPRIEITVAGRVTTATLYEDGKAVRTGTATCSPEDEFEFNRGAALACSRLTLTPEWAEWYSEKAAALDELAAWLKGVVR